MLDSYWWNFAGTGHETNGETRVKPAPGYHYYEHGQSRAQLLESFFGIKTHLQGAAEKMLVGEYRDLFPGAIGGGGGNFESMPFSADYVGDPWSEQ